ncbi:MAG: hypothetical protein V3W41_14665 [Planctomycetota bacterium]
MKALLLLLFVLTLPAAAVAQNSLTDPPLVYGKIVPTHTCSEYFRLQADVPLILYSKCERADVVPDGVVAMTDINAVVRNFLGHSGSCESKAETLQIVNGEITFELSIPPEYLEQVNVAVTWQMRPTENASELYTAYSLDHPAQLWRESNLWHFKPFGIQPAYYGMIFIVSVREKSLGPGAHWMAQLIWQNGVLYGDSDAGRMMAYTDLNAPYSDETVRSALGLPAATPVTDPLRRGYSRKNWAEVLRADLNNNGPVDVQDLNIVVGCQLKPLE